MKTCETCKHHNVTTCLRIVLIAPEGSDVAEIVADVESQAWLRVAPTFGCVLHEEKVTE